MMTKGFLIAGTNRHFLEDHTTSSPVTIVVNYGMSVSSKQIQSRFLQRPSGLLGRGQLVSEAAGF